MSFSPGRAGLPGMYYENDLKPDLRGSSLIISCNSLSLFLARVLLAPDILKRELQA